MKIELLGFFWIFTFFFLEGVVVTLLSETQAFAAQLAFRYFCTVLM